MFRIGLRIFITTLLLLCLFAVSPLAAEASHADTAAETEGISSPQRLFDGSRSTYVRIPEGASVTLSRTDGIAAVYIEFDRIPQVWSLTDANGNSIRCGQNGFLHEFVDVSAWFDALPETLTLTFPEGTVIADIYAFSSGALPDWVQIWNPPCEQADLLLLSSHSDDEQLFFAGVLPYYAVERQLNVQVVYAVQHFEAWGAPDHQRPHEQLDGLWTVGVRNYPVMSDFPDLYSESKDRAEAFSAAQEVYQNVGITYEDFVGYITECIRRFEPLVVVSHDLDGEYGHGTHVYTAAALTEAIALAADETQFPDSAAAYGPWTVEKTYLHLYEENRITMDWDTPLESLGGKTPFEVTQEGFACHKSQHWGWFYKWIYGTSDAPITKASQVRGYSPCRYGLYDTQVGPDMTGGDFFENVETYAQRAARAAAEEAARLQAEEEARLQAEAEAHAKAEAEAAAKAQAEAEAKAQAAAEAKAQAEAQAKAEQAAAAQAAAEAEAARQTRVRQISMFAGLAAVLCAAGLLAVLLRRKKVRAKH